MFDSTKEDLKDILRKADQGQLQLPDFQRDYVWSDEDVRSLLASIAKGFPVGALLTLQTGGDVTFKPRLLAGVPDTQEKPKELLLDGQQRITSLYQAIYSKQPVRTKIRKDVEVEHYYYLDINKAVNQYADLMDAIVWVSADKVKRVNYGRSIELDLSTSELEYEKDMFPINIVFDNKNWFYGWRDYWKERGRDINDLEKIFDLEVLDRIQRYEMPIIRLDSKSNREAICLVFEKVNVGGKKLDAFELVTAIYAAANFDLREDWNGNSKNKNPGRHARIIGSPNPRDVLTKIASTDFLQACTLIHTRGVRLEMMKLGLKNKELPQVSCKRDALLGLPLSAYQSFSKPLEDGFIEAGGFLNELKIIWHHDVPYPPVIVGLAAVFAILGKDTITAAVKSKLEQWFWSVTLGELYGSSTESRLARDVPELVEWINGNDQKPRSLNEALFQRDRLHSLRIRNSAAYKGIHALLMQHGCRDFITGRGADVMTFFKDEIDIHHIFPQDWCKKQGIEPGRYNAIVNKSPLSKLSNIAIGGCAPSEYLRKIECNKGISSEALDDILRTHLIVPRLLRSDDFEAFYLERTDSLCTLVSDAMGKPVVDENGTNEKEFYVEDEELPDIEL